MIIYDYYIFIYFIIICCLFVCLVFFFADKDVLPRTLKQGSRRIDGIPRLIEK